MRNKKLKKVLAVTLAAAMVAATGAACNGGSSSSQGGAASEGGATGGNVTLKMAMWDKDRSTYLNPLIDAFTKENANVSIEVVDLGSTDYMTALKTQLAGGSSGFDVVMIKDIPGYCALAGAGQLEDMTSAISDAGLKDDDFGGVLSQMKYTDEKTYGVPFRNDFWVTYYNKALFKAAGVEEPTNDMTFSQYDELARKVTKGEGNEKVYGDFFQSWRSTVELFGILDGQHTILDGEYSWMKPYYEAVLKQQKDGVTPEYATMKSSNLKYDAAFENGQTAMINMGGWYVPTLISKIKNGEADAAKDWGIVKYPHPDGVAAGSTIATLTSLGVPTSSQNKDMAKKFITFVAGEKGAQICAENGTFPAFSNDSVVDALSKMEGFPTDDKSKEALNVEKGYLEFPVCEGAAEIETNLNNAHDAIMTESVTVDEGLKQMADSVASLIPQK